MVVSAALWFACSAAYAAGPTVTQMTYDVGDHVVTVTDPRGLVTTYAHDGLGQLWQQVSPGTGTYNYDGYGRRSSMTRADGTQSDPSRDARSLYHSTQEATIHRHGG